MTPRRFFRAALAVVLAAAAAFLLLGPPFRVYTVASRTLEPAYRVGDRVFVWNRLGLSYRPRRGDVVILPAPPAASRAGEVFIKRVAGLPGEEVAVRGGRLFVNGETIAEPWVNLAYGPGPDDGPTTVPPGHVYLLGDARGISYDARFWGTVPVDSIVGPVAFSL